MIEPKIFEIAIDFKDGEYTFKPLGDITPLELSYVTMIYFGALMMNGPGEVLADRRQKIMNKINHPSIRRHFEFKPVSEGGGVKID